MGRGDHFGACKVCGNEYEADTEKQAKERHDEYEDHPFVKR